MKLHSLKLDLSSLSHTNVEPFASTRLQEICRRWLKWMQNMDSRLYSYPWISVCYSRLSLYSRRCLKKKDRSKALKKAPLKCIFFSDSLNMRTCFGQTGLYQCNFLWPVFQKNCSFCHSCTRFGIDNNQDLLFKKKHVSYLKIQYGGHFSRSWMALDVSSKH